MVEMVTARGTVADTMVVGMVKEAKAKTVEAMVKAEEVEDETEVVAMAEVAMAGALVDAEDSEVVRAAAVAQAGLKEAEEQVAKAEQVVEEAETVVVGGTEHTHNRH